MGEWLMAKLGIKRLPPVAYVVIVPIYIAISPVLLSFYLIRWMLGFWTCSCCHKTKWINEHRDVVAAYEDDECVEEWYCNSCYVAKKLTTTPEDKECDRLPDI